MSIEQGRRLLAEAQCRLRSLRALSIFDLCFEQIQFLPNDGHQWFLRRPFMHFLVMKWALASWRENDDRPLPTPEDFNFILQTAWDATPHLQGAEGRPLLFFRRITLQQIWLQQTFDGSALARQWRLFVELMPGSAALAPFVGRVGITPGAFLTQLAHMAGDMGDLMELDALSVQRPQTVRRQADWDVVRHHYSRTVSELSASMRELEARNTAPEVEVCEQTPLIKSPFLNTDQGPLCLHHKLLFRMLESALFDLTRGMGVARDFMNEFGPAFEEYVAEVLDDLGAVLVREDDLRDRLIGHGQVADFVIVSDDAVVILDAKGIDGHYDALYHNLPSEIAARFKTSILGAVDQAIATVTRLPAELQRPVAFFVCVTFKQLAITDGSALRSLTEGTPEWTSARWEAESLPPSRMFFASIHELEKLVAFANHRGNSLATVLGEIERANANPETAKALLEMHLQIPGVALMAPTCVQRAAAHLRA